MKQQIRILGIDDSPFKFGGGKALVVGTLVRIPISIFNSQLSLDTQK